MALREAPENDSAASRSSSFIPCARPTMEVSHTTPTTDLLLRMLASAI